MNTDTHRAILRHFDPQGEEHDSDAAWADEAIHILEIWCRQDVAIRVLCEGRPSHYKLTEAGLQYKKLLAV